MYDKVAFTFTGENILFVFSVSLKFQGKKGFFRVHSLFAKHADGAIPFVNKFHRKIWKLDSKIVACLQCRSLNSTVKTCFWLPITSAADTSQLRLPWSFHNFSIVVFTDCSSFLSEKTRSAAAFS